MQLNDLRKNTVKTTNLKLQEAQNLLKEHSNDKLDLGLAESIVKGIHEPEVQFIQLNDSRRSQITPDQYIARVVDEHNSVHHGVQNFINKLQTDDTVQQVSATIKNATRDTDQLQKFLDLDMDQLQKVGTEIENGLVKMLSVDPNTTTVAQVVAMGRALDEKLEIFRSISNKDKLAQRNSQLQKLVQSLNQGPVQVERGDEIWDKIEKAQHLLNQIPQFKDYFESLLHQKVPQVEAIKDQIQQVEESKALAHEKQRPQVNPEPLISSVQQQLKQGNVTEAAKTILSGGNMARQSIDQLQQHLQAGVDQGIIPAEQQKQQQELLNAQKGQLDAIEAQTQEYGQLLSIKHNMIPQAGTQSAEDLHSIANTLNQKVDMSSVQSLELVGDIIDVVMTYHWDSVSDADKSIFTQLHRKIHSQLGVLQPARLKQQQQIEELKQQQEAQNQQMQMQQLQAMRAPVQASGTPAPYVRPGGGTLFDSVRAAQGETGNPSGLSTQPFVNQNRPNRRVIQPFTPIQLQQQQPLVTPVDGRVNKRGQGTQREKSHMFKQAERSYQKPSKIMGTGRFAKAVRKNFAKSGQQNNLKEEAGGMYRYFVQANLDKAQQGLLQRNAMNRLTQQEIGSALQQTGGLV